MFINNQMNFLIPIILTIVVIVVVIFILKHGNSYESVDDEYVEEHIDEESPTFEEPIQHEENVGNISEFLDPKEIEKNTKEMFNNPDLQQVDRSVKQSDDKPNIDIPTFKVSGITDNFKYNQTNSPSFTEFIGFQRSKAYKQDKLNEEEFNNESIGMLKKNSGNISSRLPAANFKPRIGLAMKMMGNEGMNSYVETFNNYKKPQIIEKEVEEKVGKAETKKPKRRNVKNKK